MEWGHFLSGAATPPSRRRGIGRFLHKPALGTLIALSLMSVVLSSPLIAQDSGKQDSGKQGKEKGGVVQFEFKHRPTLRIGKLFRADVRVKVQTDFRSFSPDVETDEGTFDLHRGRLGLEGEFLKVFEYEVERDFRQTLGRNDQRYPWKDVYGNFKYFDNFQLKFGKFKVPFGMEELTGEHQIDFAQRTRISDDLTPGRDVGAMLHGRFFKRGLSYEAGYFRHDGENGRNHNGDPIANDTYAARVTGTPLRELAVPKVIRPVEIGAAFTWSDVPEGLSSVRGNTVMDQVYFPYVYVKGPRRRVGAEANWITGPFSLKGEFIKMTEAREQQGIYFDDLPAKVSRGWYVTGTWVITGEKKEGGVEPKKQLFDGGFGAVEIAGRFEQIRFGTDTTGDAFSTPRSPNLRPQRDRAVTFGLNWYANRYMKIQADGIRETLEDPFRSPIPGRTRFWTGMLRLQFVM